MQLHGISFIRSYLLSARTSDEGGEYFEQKNLTADQWLTRIHQLDHMLYNQIF